MNTKKYLLVAAALALLGVGACGKGKAPPPTPVAPVAAPIVTKG